MNDFDETANKKHSDSASSAPDDAPSDAQTAARSAATDSSPSAGSPVVSHPDASTEALRGEPNAATALVWCRVCKDEVRPEKKGTCPRCKKFLKLNFVARRHPVNVLRRDTLLADLLKQFPPANILERTTCERLAGAMEQLESIKPGSTDWQRLVQTEQVLAAALHEARRSREVEPNDAADLTLDEVIDELQSLSRTALDLRNTRPPVETPTTSPLVAPSAPAAPAPPQPELRCQYGCGTLTRCAEIKASNYDAWECLHTLDPEVVRKKDAEATRIMRAQVGKWRGYPS